MLQISQVSAEAEFNTVRVLLREYHAQLGVDLCFQGFESELAALPGVYALPAGRLLLAMRDGVAAGCIALRPAAAERGEIKRLYVREVARGQGLGQALLDRILAEARIAGYRGLVLDTLPSMVAAQELYLRAGFTDIVPYTSNPVPGARFLGLDFDVADARPDEGMP